MRKSRARWLVPLVSMACLLFAGSAQAAVSGITGLSDLRIARTNGAYGEWNAGVRTLADIAGPQIRQARYQVRWDVATLAATDPDRQAFQNWLVSVAARGWTPLVSFWPSPVRSEPTRAEYRAAVAQFRSTWSGVTEFTAWNEPNHPLFLVSETTAVDYYEALTSVCGSSCTVAAGDFSGNPNSSHPYWTRYKAGLNARGLTPRVWAYHPYEVINSGTDVNRFKGLDDFVPMTDGKPIWFTEIGAFYCRGGSTLGDEESQRQAAARLQELISSPSLSAYNSTLTRVYYYQFSGGDWASTPSNCPKDDYGLINMENTRGGAPRAATYELLPQLAGHWWSTRSTNSGGGPDGGFAFTGSGRYKLSGDFDGDGVDTPATYDNGLWQIRTERGSGPANLVFSYGDSTHTPVVGDWNGDGIDTIGVYAQSIGVWFLRNSNTAGSWDLEVHYGNTDLVPTPGDFNGDGIDTVGVRQPSTGNWMLRNSNTAGPWDIGFEYGGPWTYGFVGDWDGNGADSIGTFSAEVSQFFLRNENSSGTPSYTPFLYEYGIDGRVFGDWDGNGTDTPAIVR